MSSSVVQFGGDWRARGIAGVQSPAFRDELQARRDLFYDGIRDDAAGRLRGTPPAGAFYAFLQDRSGLAAVAWRGSRIALLGDGGVPDSNGPHRLRAGCRLRRAWRRLRAFLLRARPRGAHGALGLDAGLVRALSSWSHAESAATGLSRSMLVTCHVPPAIHADRLAGDEVDVEQERPPPCTISSSPPQRPSGVAARHVALFLVRAYRAGRRSVPARSR